MVVNGHKKTLIKNGTQDLMLALGASQDDLHGLGIELWKSKLQLAREQKSMFLTASIAAGLFQIFAATSNTFVMLSNNRSWLIVGITLSAFVVGFILSLRFLVGAYRMGAKAEAEAIREIKKMEH